MDKLKEFMGKVSRHRFWILLGLISIIGVTTMVIADGSLHATTTANKARILDKHRTMEQLLSTGDHPNADWKQNADQITAAMNQTVTAAWTKIYDAQKEFLVWPEELGPGFLSNVREAAPDGELLTENRGVFFEAARSWYFDSLLEHINAKPDYEKAARPGNFGGPVFGGGGRPGGNPFGGQVDDDDDAPAAAAAPAHAELERVDLGDYTVEWNSKSQAHVREYFLWPQAPEDSGEIYRAQEDFWIAWNILSVIQKVNWDEEAGRKMAFPRITKILEFEIGSEAGDHYEKALKGQSGRPGGGGGGAVNPFGDAFVPPVAGGLGVEKANPRDKRYFTSDCKRMTVAEAKAAAFKCVPVHIKLVMDQREIIRMMVESANAHLWTEIKHLSVKQLGAKAENRIGERGAFRAFGGDAPVFGAPPAGNALANLRGELEQYDVPVEIYFIVYIFNSPESHGITKAPASAPVDGQ